MLSIIFQRLWIGVITVFFVSLIIFVCTQILPGDAAEMRLGQAATDETRAALRKELGLDQPIYMQYLNWAGNFLQGDLGKSLAGDRSISESIGDRYQATLTVSILTAAIGIPVSLFLGIMAAMFPGSLYDRILTFVSVSLVAVPEFFTATLMVLIFVFAWEALFGFQLANAVVVGSTDDLNVFELIGHYALPIATLCFVIASQLIRMTRAAVLNVMSSPYIEMAILKGVPRKRIILRHALLNAIGPIVNVIALNLAYLVSGVVVVEVYFAYNGLATFIVQGVQQRDFVLVQSIGMLFCATYVILMLLADIASIVSNPRLRHPK
ncbi:MAG: ABC transporter permease [Alphaproteobacteria bacterium]|nr:ABC transporter permease [Alphaproteobacteria bacterium]